MVLVVYRSRIGIVRAKHEVVAKQDPHEQALAICALLAQSVPLRVVEEFAALTDADLEKIIALGASATQRNGSKHRQLSDAGNTDRENR